MLNKFTKQGVRHWQQRLFMGLLTRARWWEVGVIIVCLGGSVAGLYWWLWRPVAGDAALARETSVQLDVATLEQLTKWLDERERGTLSGGVAERFNELFE